MNPKVSIIILNWKGWQDTLECLDSIKKIKHSNYETLIIDNGSGDESVAQINKYLADNNLSGLKSNFKLFAFERNFGFAGGNNKGIEQAIKNGADYVLLLNNDTTVDPFFLDALIQTAETDKNIGIVGSKIYFYFDPKRIWFAGGKINWLKNKGTHLDLNKKDLENNKSDEMQKFFSVDYITGCSMLIKKEVVEKIGGLDEDYFLYYEDADYCLRAKKEGWRSVLAPDSVIWHKISQSTKEFSPSYLYYHARNGLLMAKRMNIDAKIILVYIFSFLLALKQVIKYLFFPARREWAKMTMQGIWDFWRGKIGKMIV